MDLIELHSLVLTSHHKPNPPKDVPISNPGKLHETYDYLLNSFTQLTLLDLSMMKITTLARCDLCKLRTLRLSSCTQLTENGLVPFLSQLHELEELNLYDCLITKKILKALPNTLTKLSLSNADGGQLDESDVEIITSKSSLISLSLPNCGIKDLKPFHLLINLRFLFLKNKPPFRFPHTEAEELRVVLPHLGVGEDFGIDYEE